MSNVTIKSELFSSKAMKRPRSPSLADQDHRILHDSSLSNNNHHAIQTPEGKLIRTGDLSDTESDSIADVELVSTDSIVRQAKIDMFHHDPRKRRDSLSSLAKVSGDIDFTVYPELCEALHDDYERCRSIAINLILAMSSKYGNSLVFPKNSNDQIRLEDDAFVKICKMITDSDVQVRIEAAKSLTQFRSVGVEFLLATLDKKLDGAFVFGLEDERKNVRIAALESLCQLSKNQPKFAEKSIDHIVDMFNDEIEDIRLKAIQCLQEIGNVALRDDQVEIILTVLDSPLMDLREAMHKMLAKVNITSARSLRRCIETILFNLARYPQDKLSIFGCFKLLGENLPDLVHSLVNELLAIHPYLKLPEHSLIDDNYIATLILIFNASSKTPAILDCLEPHTLQHRTYIRHTLPNFMPAIEALVRPPSKFDFFKTLFKRLSEMLKSKQPLRSKIALMEMSLQDLNSYGLVEPVFKASTEFYQIIIKSILIISQVLTSPDWSSSKSSLILIYKVLDQTFSLLKKYHKLSKIQRCCIQQLRIQALAIELVVHIKSSKNSTIALNLCDDFVEEVRSLDGYLEEQPFIDSTRHWDLKSCISNELNSFVMDSGDDDDDEDDDDQQPVKEEQIKEESKAIVARKLEPLMNKFTFSLDQIFETLILLIDSQDLAELKRMKTSKATINNTLYKSDSPYRFTAGLVLELTLDALIENITDIDDIRVKVSYPDRQAHIIVPIANHFRLISSDEHSNTSSYRLYSTVNICHSTWTNASFVDLTIVLDYRDNQSTSIDLTTTRLTEKSQIIDICRPLNLKIHPQSIKW